MAGRGDQQRRGGRQAELPDGLRGVERGHEERKVQRDAAAFGIAGELHGDDGGEREAEGPVAVGGGGAEGDGEDDNLIRGAGHAGEFGDEGAEQRRGGDGGAHEDDERHLRGEREEAPEAFVVGRGDGLRGRAEGERHGGEGDEEDDAGGDGVRDVLDDEVGEAVQACAAVGLRHACSLRRRLRRRVRLSHEADQARSSGMSAPPNWESWRKRPA
jgi:hypothetical protein